MSEERKGFLKRRAEGAGRYVRSRIGNRYINEVGTSTVRQTVSSAREAMTPRAWDSDEMGAGFRGRYADGGVARFAEVMRERGLGTSDLQALAAQRQRNARIMFAAAGGFLLFGLAMVVSASDFEDILHGLVTSFPSAIFGALGLRSSFERWQLTERRFGGLLEYFRGLPAPSRTSQGVPTARSDAKNGSKD